MTAKPKWAALHADSGWEIRSPRGIVTHTTPNPAYARQVANAMAGVDALLARANNTVSRTYGLHAVGGAR